MFVGGLDVRDAATSSCRRRVVDMLIPQQSGSSLQEISWAWVCAPDMLAQRLQSWARAYRGPSAHCRCSQGFHHWQAAQLGLVIRQFSGQSDPQRVNAWSRPAYHHQGLRRTSAEGMQGSEGLAAAAVLGCTVFCCGAVALWYCCLQYPKTNLLRAVSRNQPGNQSRNVSSRLAPNLALHALSWMNTAPWERKNRAAHQSCSWACRGSKGYGQQQFLSTSPSPASGGIKKAQNTRPAGRWKAQWV